jgi:hypothetical protein
MPYGVYKHKPLTEERKKNIAKSLLGKKRHPHTEEAKQKMRLAHLGKPNPNSGKARLGKPTWNKGKQCPQTSGEKNGNWRGGEVLRARIRSSFKNRQWISDVFERDNFTCQITGERGGKLEAHHIKPFALIIQENNIKTFEDAMDCEELWNINNGMTLSKNAHKEIHKKNEHREKKEN